MAVSRGITQSSRLDHPSLCVTYYQAGVGKTRRLYSITEMSSNMSLGINNNDISTLRAALLERMYYCEVEGEFVPPPIVKAKTFRNRCGAFKSELLGLVGTATPVSLDDVVEMYKGRKKTIYQNARNEVALFGYSRDDAIAFSFVKEEKVNPAKAARCIQPRNARYNINLARYIKPIEHRIYEKIAKIFGDGPTVMKGYNVEQIGGVIRGKWRSFNNPVAIGLDATKFDMHVSVAALEWEHSIYNRIYADAELKKMLTWQVNNKGRGYCDDGELRYSVKGRRFSGDMNTALGNCLIMCALVWTWMQECSIKAKLVNNGDDCVVIMEREDEQKFMDGLSAWFLEMGFRMVAEPPVYNLCEIEFCQMHPIEMGSGVCLMVRNIPASLRKDSLSTQDLSILSVRESYMNAVGVGGLAINGGVPILQNFYQALTRLGCGRVSKMADHLNRNRGMYFMSNGIQRVYEKPTPLVRLQVFMAWGYTPEEQLELEAYYDNFTIVGEVSVVDSHINNNTIFLN